MPYSVEWKERGAHWKFTGIVTGQEILQADLDLYGDERFDNLSYALFDFSGGTSFALTEKEMKEIAYLDMASTPTNPNIKLAIVASHDVMKKMSGLYAEYMELSPWETKIFDTVEEAKQWLNLPV